MSLPEDATPPGDNDLLLALEAALLQFERAQNAVAAASIPVLKRALTIDQITDICSRHNLNALEGGELAASNAVAAYVSASEAMVRAIRSENPTGTGTIDIGIGLMNLNAEGFARVSGVTFLGPGADFVGDLSHLVENDRWIADDFGAFLRSAWNTQPSNWRSARQDIKALSETEQLGTFVKAAMLGVDMSRAAGEDFGKG